MADTPTPDQEPELTAEEALRQRLLGRIAVAAVVIVGLLGSLAMFDALYAPAPPLKVASQAPAAAPAATPAPAPIPVPPTVPAEPAKEEPKAAAEPATPSAPPTATLPPPPPPVFGDAAKPAPTVVAKATPEGTSSTGAPPLAPLPPEKPLTKPATPRQANIRPSEPAVPPPVATRPDPQREVARAPWSGTRNAPASRPLTQAVAAARSFALQLGVFNNIANAEELRSKLEQNGIPSVIEARVQVGPFKTREEVEATREKLRALGLETGIMVSMKK